jgi:hypothetical protein
VNSPFWGLGPAFEQKLKRPPIKAASSGSPFATLPGPDMALFCSFKMLQGRYPLETAWGKRYRLGHWIPRGRTEDE